jgi:hypothetical protein
MHITRLQIDHVAYYFPLLAFHRLLCIGTFIATCMVDGAKK